MAPWIVRPMPANLPALPARRMATHVPWTNAMGPVLRVPIPPEMQELFVVLLQASVMLLIIAME
jgi:hypothetical protein